MKVVKKIILTEEEREACRLLKEIYFSDDDIFECSEDLADFIHVVDRGDATFKSMEIEVEE